MICSSKLIIVPLVPNYLGRVVDRRAETPPRPSPNSVAANSDSVSCSSYRRPMCICERENQSVNQDRGRTKACNQSALNSEYNTLICTGSNRGRCSRAGTSRHPCRSIRVADSRASPAAIPCPFPARVKCNQEDPKRKRFDGSTWNSCRFSQYGSVRRHPMTHALSSGYCLHISNRAPFTVPRIALTVILYLRSHSLMKSSISSNGFSG